MIFVSQFCNAILWASPLPPFKQEPAPTYHSGNYVKMVHNGIEYGDMQMIAEAYDVMKHVGGLTNVELAHVFTTWNASELESFLIEITGVILGRKDDQGAPGELVDYILDKTGMKGTGRWTIQEAAERNCPGTVMAAALDSRYISARKDERVAAEDVLKGLPTPRQHRRSGTCRQILPASHAHSPPPAPDTLQPPFSSCTPPTTGSRALPAFCLPVRHASEEPTQGMTPQTYLSFPPSPE